MVRVERNVSRPSLEEGEQRDVGFDAAVDEHRDAIAGSDAARDEEARHPIGPRLEFAVAHVRVLGGNRCSVRVTAARLLDHIAKALAMAPSKGRTFAEDRNRVRRLETAQWRQGIVFERRLAQNERGGEHGSEACCSFFSRRCSLARMAAMLQVLGQPP